MKKPFFLLFLLVTACIKDETPPVGTIPPDSMSLVIMDVLINESKIAIQNQPVDTALIFYNVYKTDLYKKYNINSERFDSSMNYYMRNTKQMDKIMEQVVDSLGLRESRGKID
jgi:hypothetical protein